MVTSLTIKKIIKVAEIVHVNISYSHTMVYFVQTSWPLNYKPIVYVSIIFVEGTTKQLQYGCSG